MIAFHSLEDRIVKHFLPAERPDLQVADAQAASTPADRPRWRANPRSRSAKLRAAEKLDPAGAS